LEAPAAQQKMIIQVEGQTGTEGGCSAESLPGIPVPFLFTNPSPCCSLPPPHGSRQRLETLDGDESKRFYLQVADSERTRD
jgi:hypothetical protein